MAHTRMLQRFIWCLGAGTVLLGMVTCTSKPATNPVPKKFVVTIPPLEGLLRPIAKATGGSIETLVPVGVVEHGYEIPPDKLASLATADVVVCVGLGLEPSVDSYLRSNPSDSRLVLTFADLVGVEAADEHHDHEGESHDHDHAHGSIDPHVWLDPALVEQFVQAVQIMLDEWTRGASGAEVANESIRSAAQSVIESVRAVDAEYRTMFGCPPAGYDASTALDRTIVVQHDAYHHLALAYGLHVIALSGAHAEETSPDDMAMAVEEIKNRNLKAVYFEPQDKSGMATSLAKSLSLDALALDPLGSGDWSAMMRANLASLRAGLGSVKVLECKSSPLPTPGQ